MPQQELLGILNESHLTLDTWAYFWSLNPVLLICMTVLTPGPHSLDDSDFRVCFELRTCVFSFLFSKVIPAAHGSSWPSGRIEAAAGGLQCSLQQCWIFNPLSEASN